MFLSRLGLVVIAAAAFLVPASPAAPNTFGIRFLQVNQCCGGAGLYGTKASIWTPFTSSDLTFPTTNCHVARSDAEWFGQLVQAGWARCASGTSNGPCSTNNDLVKFVEHYYSPSNHFCINKGAIGYNTEVYYTVRRVDPGGNWFAYIGGIQDTTPYCCFGGANLLIEGAEWTGSCSESFRGSYDYATSISWQRWTSTSWFQVQSSSKQLDCGYLDYGSPPGAFGFSHS
jgi:hypothetical protein